MQIAKLDIFFNVEFAGKKRGHPYRQPPLLFKTYYEFVSFFCNSIVHYWFGYVLKVFNANTPP